MPIIREGQIHKDWKDETVEEEQIKKQDTRNIIFIIFMAIAVFGFITPIIFINLIRSKDTSSTDESSYSITNESKHKVALIIIDDQLIEYEYSWAMSYSSNGTITIKLKDGTELETFIGNVYLFEYDTDDCESLNEIRNKLM